jgi:hypothetical protein
METITSAIGGVRRHVGRTDALPILILPAYRYLMLLMIGILAVGLVGWAAAVRLNVQFPDPFAAYTDIFPGQPRSAVIARGFSCQSSPQYCTAAPADGPFFLVAVTLANDSVRRLDFTVRQNTLVMGDLPLAWGRPRIQIYQESVILNWTALGVSANGWAASRHFDYFMPLVRISFSRASS